MIHTKYYLDTRKKLKSGIYTLRLYIVNGTDTAYFPVNVKLSPSEWNGAKVVKRDDAMRLNAMLGKYKSEMDMRIVNLSMEYDLELMRMIDVKYLLEEQGKRKVAYNATFSDMLSQYLEKDLSNGTRAIYSELEKKVYAFSGKGTLMREIDYKWLLSFDKYLAKTQGINGKAIYLRHLRAICNYALHTNVIDKSPFANFKIKHEATKHRAVDIETLRRFYHHPVNKQQERMRDYFFLMFFLIGINVTDLLYAKPDAIVNGRLEYVRAKTHKKYTIKVEPEAQALLDKYKGVNHLVDAIEHYSDIKVFLHVMSKALRSIGEEVVTEVSSDNIYMKPLLRHDFKPVIPGVTSYYTRHSWATIASDLGIPIDVVSFALGHSLGNKTTLIYVKQDQGKVDAANRQVIDYLLYAP